MDYEIPRCSRQCAKTEREIAPGEGFYSALIDDGESIARHDYALDAWDGPPDDAIGWWKSKVPEPSETKMHWAPNDVMLQLFDQLEEQPDKHDMRYVLALLLVRRRVLREEGMSPDMASMTLYCPRRDTCYEVAVVTPTTERVNEIQDELAKLLFCKSL